MSDRYRTRVERAIRYIARHRNRDLTVAEVAKHAHLSEVYFHRIFRAVVGESAGRYITRRRLEVAALRLVYEPARSVTDIALSSGYSSLSDFSKAFTAFWDVNPSQVRGPDLSLAVAIHNLMRATPREFRPEDLYVLPPEDPTLEQELAKFAREVRFETCAGFDIACLASADQDAAAVGRTWTELIGRVLEIGLGDFPAEMWGMAFDSLTLMNAPELGRYHAGVSCPIGFEPPAPLFRGRIPAGRYAVFHYAGELAGLPRRTRAIYSLWLPRSNVEVDEFPPIDHYDYIHLATPGYIDYELWIKVQPHSS